MEGTGTRWLVTLCLLTAAQCLPSRVTSQSETDSEDSRRVLGSRYVNKTVKYIYNKNIKFLFYVYISVVTSVSVIMDHGNGTKTYFADGQSKNVHKSTDTIIGSPGNLLSPDRYEFYTFDDTGDLVKRLMTLEEIHGLIAGADPESVMADASPTYYHDALSSHSSEALMHLPASDLESLDAPAVHKVLESVQNVLKNEMAANSGKPIPSMTSASLHRPDSVSAWSALFPGLIETPDDVAHLSGYLLPSRTTESMDKPFTKKPLTSTKLPLTSTQPPSTILKLPSSSIKTQFTTTTEKVRSTPKYTTVSPELSTKFTPTQSTTYKSSTTKKPFKPIQSFEKQKPALQKPTSFLHLTTKQPIMSDNLDINKEMSASISDMLSQVTDSQPSNHKPLQTNTLIEKDNTADYIPEESSPEISYYSPIAMALSTSGALKPVTEALTMAKKPSFTASFKTTTTEIPFSQKSTSTMTTRFGPTKSNVTKHRPSMNVTTASYIAKPSSFNKFNGSTTISTTRNNYQYPPSNMSTKYMQKITQTTQIYPSKLIEPSIKVVNKTVNNATLSIKQSTEAFLNSTADEIKNKFVKEPNKVFQNKVTSVRPTTINRTNVTLSNRIQELKTTTIPNYSSGSSTTTVRNQTEPDKFVSVKVEDWPQQSTVSPLTIAYVSTEKSFSSSNNQPLNAITDASVIRDLISSLMTKPTTVSSTSTSTVSPTTITNVPTLTAALLTTPSTPAKTVTEIPISLISSTTQAPMSTTSTTTTTTTTSTTTSGATAATTTEATTTAATTTIGTEVMVKTAVEAAVVSATTTAATTPAVISTASSTIDTSTTASSTVAAAIAKTTASISTTVTSTTPESETQYVPVTHFLPELQVKDKPETEKNSSTPAVDVMLKDGISAVANMLQNTQKPAMLDAQYQEIGERPYEKVVVEEGKQSSTEQARKQATVKTDFKETTTILDSAITQELYEFTTTAAESITKFPELNDTIAMESVTVNNTEEISRNSEPGLEMLTVFNVSSTGGPVQVAKLADLSAAETQTFYDTTTPYEYHIVTTDAVITSTEDPIVSTFIPKTVTTSSTTFIPKTFTTNSTTMTMTTTTKTTMAPTTTTTTVTPQVQNGTTPIIANTTAAFITNSTTMPTFSSGIKSPGPSSNAYRPLANSVSPSTVELHPAPHESMGLEASVAFLGDDVRRFSDLCNELSFKMWTTVTGKGQITSRSLVLSPFELTAMLAMVFLGARGSTSGQMNDVLRLDDMVTFNPHQVLRNITHSITNVNNPGVATASFVREIYSNKVRRSIHYS